MARTPFAAVVSALLLCWAWAAPAGPGPFAPTAADPVFTVHEDSEALLPLRPGDVTAGAGPGQIEILSPPAHGTLHVEDGSVRYRPHRGFNGGDVFSYRWRQRGEGAESGTARITVYRQAAAGAPQVFLPRASILPAEVAVVLNEADPVSERLADHYTERRAIPPENLIRVRLPTDTDALDPEAFAATFRRVRAQLPPAIQAFVLVWSQPYRVGCMSITSAFALGRYDEAYCSWSPCSPTASSPYYRSASTRPYDDHGIRPAMLLAGRSEAAVRQLIDRGLAADGSLPAGTGFLVRTSDAARSVRWATFLDVSREPAIDDSVELTYVDNADGSGCDAVAGQGPVLFYFTGLARVPAAATNLYPPGAVADHLTSFGGRLTDSRGQMTVLDWLAAGVTGSYGTVVEPCNYAAKFPNPAVLMPSYFQGQTLLEAYWKSVRWPGEGLFVGEPLARPWGRDFLTYTDGTLTIRTTALSPQKNYRLVASAAPEGPFETVLDDIRISRPRLVTLSLAEARQSFYQLEEVSGRFPPPAMSESAQGRPRPVGNAESDGNPPPSAARRTSDRP